MIGPGFNPHVLDGLVKTADPLTQPLDAFVPGTWALREARVEWCLANLTKGEKALLYRMLHAEGLHLADCRALEATEKKGLKR